MNRATTTLLLALAAAPAAAVAQDVGRAGVVRDLDRLRRGEQVAGLPVADSVTAGGRTVAAGAVARGTIVARGPIEVFGRVEGSVVSLAGDVTVHRGGVVTGDALAVHGHVNADSGLVGGELRTMSALPAVVGAVAARADVRTPAQRTMDSIRIVSGSFGILLIIAVGVLLFAGPNLEEVAAALEGRVARAFWYGVLGQLAVVPGLVVLVVALALTVIGILLIPFAAVAYATAVAGLVTLGFLAVARVVGGAAWRGGDASARARSFGALFAGVSIFLAPWLVGAALAWTPLAASLIRSVALATTWAAATLGLGAAILSRAGTHRRSAAGTRPVELAAWQTPTPVAGVVAARRTVGAREAR